MKNKAKFEYRPTEKEEICPLCGKKIRKHEYSAVFSGLEIDGNKNDIYFHEQCFEEKVEQTDVLFIRELQQTISDLEFDNAILEEERDEYGGEVDDLKGQLADLDSIIVDRDREISRLEEEVQELERELQDARDEVEHWKDNADYIVESIQDEFSA